MFKKFFFFENRAVYEIMWRNIVEADRPQMKIWRMRIESWVPRATHTYTHSKYVKPTTLPLQEWLHEDVAKLSYTYSLSRVMSKWHKNHPCGAAAVQLWLLPRTDELSTLC